MADTAMADTACPVATAAQGHIIQLEQTSTPDCPTPPRPVPESDPKLASDADKTPPTPPQEPNLFTLPATDALRLLSASIELLVRMTGDIPPTPPPKTVTNPQMSDMQAEKENIVRSHSNKNLAQLRREASRETLERRISNTGSITGKRSADEEHAGSKTKLQAYSAAMSAQLASQQPGGSAPEHAPIDGVKLRADVAAKRSPPPTPYIVVGADSQPLNLQHGAITRKFYSKNEPPISINQYLVRLHQFCPMSSAVYLATSLYIHRLAVEERVIPVTRRNAHRLVLAGLRVAMKALEDLSYPHTKFAKVGGVSEGELARLEISFCFLTGFELVVGEELLQGHWEALRNGNAQAVLDNMEPPTLTLSKKAA